MSDLDECDDFDYFEEDYIEEDFFEGESLEDWLKNHEDEREDVVGTDACCSYCGYCGGGNNCEEFDGLEDVSHD
jgi:hypothetical protein